MKRFNKLYLSGQTHDNAVSIATVSGVGTSVYDNMYVNRAQPPLLREYTTITIDETKKYEVSFYPFFLTKVSKKGDPFYFKHYLKNAVYPYSISVEDKDGVVIDPSYYYIKEDGSDLALFHNFVNTKDNYYFVRYSKQITSNMINFGHRELIQSQPAMREFSKGSPLTKDTYYVNIKTDGIDLFVDEAGEYYIAYDNKQLIFFPNNYNSRQHWHMAVRRFAYKLPTVDKIFSTEDNYTNEDFHPYIGINFLSQKDIETDENDVLFLAGFPLLVNEIEFPIMEMSSGKMLPIRSIDPYTGCIQINRDDLDDADQTEFDLNYFVAQNYVVLDDTNLIYPKQEFVDFNPVYNQDIVGKYCLIYLRSNTSTGEKIHQAFFEPADNDGINEFYMTDIVPYDSILSPYLTRGNRLSYKDFYDNFNVLRNPDGTDSVLFLGVALLHDKTLPARVRQFNVDDIRYLGGGIQEDMLETALTGYPETKYYWELQATAGDALPAMGSFIALIPENLLTFLSEDDIKDKIGKHARMCGYISMIKYTKSSLEKV